MKITNRNIIAWLVAVSILPTLAIAALPGETGKDLDKDEIDDGYEQFLLNKLGPVFYLGKLGKIHPASSLSWCVKHTTGLYDDPDRKKLLWSPKDKGDPVGEFIKANASKNYGAGDYLNLGAPIRKGEVRGDKMTWKRANDEQLGFFGRVWRPARGDANHYWVQYYMFLLFSDSGVELDIGSHEGDWVCLQMDVDVTAKSAPRIDTVYYFNHGQIFVVPKSQVPVDKSGRVIAYMEEASNELWPTTKGSEKELPSKAKILFNKEGVRVRDHKGDSGDRYEFRSPLNVGEKTRPMFYEDRDKSNEVQLFFMAINWGAWWRDADWADYSTSSPQSPPHQEKMWERARW